MKLRKRRGGACDGASSWTVRVLCASQWFLDLTFLVCVCGANQEVECTVWIQSCDVYSPPHPGDKDTVCVSGLMYKASVK